MQKKPDPKTSKCFRVKHITGVPRLSSKLEVRCSTTNSTSHSGITSQVQGALLYLIINAKRPSIRELIYIFNCVSSRKSFQGKY
jgi:hypothetical protein